MRRSLVLTTVAAVVLAALAGLLIWAAFTGVGPAEEDGEALAEAVAVRSGALTALAVVLTDLGSTAAMAILAVVVAVVLFVRGRRLDALWFVGTMVTAAGLFTLLKRLTDRPRPPLDTQLVHASSTSLPSGHATMAAAVIGALVVLAWPHLRGLRRWLAVAAAVVWIVAIGLTRVYLGVHWYSDVVAGWATGLAWLAVCTGVLVRVRARTVDGARVAA